MINPNNPQPQVRFNDQSLPWVGIAPTTDKQECKERTVKFVANVRAKVQRIIEAEISNNTERLGPDDVVDEHREVVDKFICPICRYVMINMVCCSQCEVLACKACINEWKSRSNGQCPHCRNKHEEIRIINMVKNMLNDTRFKCKKCSSIFTYEGRYRHWRECFKLNIQLDSCPFGCQTNKSINVNQLMKHVEEECTGE